MQRGDDARAVEVAAKLQRERGDEGDLRSSLEDGETLPALLHRILCPRSQQKTSQFSGPRRWCLAGQRASVRCWHSFREGAFGRVLHIRHFEVRAKKGFHLRENRPAVSCGLT